ncbi:DUF6343 family protein [uncultured Pseudokineococcus sp.]|uniref:DUF6343 family protein n=1 Tax=uncultured Pseudokineococcus sp. TaxID=1642928 RepID=UPI00261C7DB8|nr:DUF6343 family protein [uncultured Pseudokineococcus sp.]
MANTQPDRPGGRRPSAPPARGDGEPLEPRYGIGGSAPARSALTLRAVLAALGLVVCAGGAAWAGVVGAPAWLVVVLVLLAVVAVVDLVVIGRRKARGEPG